MTLKVSSLVFVVFALIPATWSCTTEDVSYCQVQSFVANTKPKNCTGFCEDAVKWAKNYCPRETCNHLRRCNCDRRTFNYVYNGVGVIEEYKKIHFYGGHCLNWHQAQCVCCKVGGRLWEPKTEHEYNSVVSAATDAGFFEGMTSQCGWWLGMLNFNNLDNDRMRYTFYNPLSLVPADPAWNSPMPVMTDGFDGNKHNAVGRFGPLLPWPASGTVSSAGMRDWNSACTFMAPICEYDRPTFDGPNVLATAAAGGNGRVVEDFVAYDKNDDTVA